MKPGALYLVATPIGNLEDLTLRALRVLREVDLIACEDTRRTRKLLAHHDVHTPVISYHEHNERTRAADLVARLAAGASVALVSDAGMPGISDPGHVLVREALASAIAVVPVPGPSAVTAALAVAGLPAEQFTFVGFLPRRPGERRRAMEALRGLPHTLVLFEAPHRIVRTLADIRGVLGDRRVALVREMTKVHEEIIRGTAGEVMARLEAAVPRGEMTLVVAGAAPEDQVAHPGAGAGDQERRGASSETTETSAESRPSAAPATVEEHLRRLLAAGVSRRDAVRRVAAAHGLPRREVYRRSLAE
ncbi:MAG: 16S rRNA (cytidine(1402)-2'-O)-methyltransferase [Armatimonadetes bacterium]|nr:16S rRNA (cytidine(1402)-2'-O)-methyltransferase [Armatimonadota bacterium]